MELVDTSIVNVALSDMAGSLGVSIEDISWVITSYAIANVIIIPLTSFLAEYFGRKNYYIASMIIFTLASYMCGQSTGLVEIIVWRFVQGVGGGALLSTSQAILFDAFEPQLSLIHISEPTRQAETSYAVFCLKKKNNEHRHKKKTDTDELYTHRIVI